MEPSLFNEQDIRQSNNHHFTRPFKHANTDVLIEPWFNTRIPINKTLPLPLKAPSKPLERDHSERKKTMDERIEEMYRKYSKEGISVNRENQRANSRQIYREMLREFEKAQQFKQIGAKREKSVMETEIEQISIDTLNKKINSGVCAYDYKQIRANQSPPRINKAQLKCADKFQRMMKIREKIRRKNNMAVSKQKDKYLSEYHPTWQYSHRESTIENFAMADKQKSKTKDKSRNHSRSNIVIDDSNIQNEFKVVGVYSNALQYTIHRSINSSNAMRGAKYRNRTLNHTYHSFNN